MAAVYKSCTDLFAKNPVDVSFTNTSWEEVNARELTNNGQTIDFIVQSTEAAYLQLSESFLYLYCQVVNDKNEAPAEDSKSYYVNGIANSLFDTVTVFCNETQIGDGIHYNYRSIAESMVNYNIDYGLTAGPLAGFWYDSNPGDETAANRSISNRQTAFKDANGIELCTRISHDLFNMESLLPPGIQVRVRLQRAKDEFVLVSKDAGKKYRVNIKEAVLMVRRAHLLPSISLRNHQLLEQNGVMKLPMRKSVVRSFVIPQGHTSYSNETLLTGNLPERLTIFLVKNSSAFGKLDENPYTFEDFAMRSIQVSANNNMYNCPAIHVNKEQDRLAKLYMMSYLSVTSNQSNEPLGIPWEAFKQTGNFMSIFDLRDVRGTTANLLPRTGTIRISLEFKAGLAQAVSCFVLGEYSAVLQIDKLLNVEQKDSMEELGSFD